MTNAAVPAQEEAPSLPAYSVPPPGEDVIKEIKAIVSRGRGIDPDDLWYYEHEKTHDWVIYRPASKQEISQYQKQYREQADRGALGNTDIAEEFLVKTCVLYPEYQPHIVKLLTKRALIGAMIASEICRVTGYSTEAIQKKL